VKDSGFNRREFLGAAATVAAAGVVGSPQPVDAGSALERVRLGVIGLRQQGQSLLRELTAIPDADIAAVCDVDPRLYADALTVLSQQGRPTPAVMSDYRELLDDPSIDGVVIATPDHWHADMAAAACEAGKDLYVEAPLAHTVRGGMRIVEAAKTHRRIVQTGLQQRSGRHFQSAVEAVQQGEIGTVRLVKAWVSHRRNVTAPIENTKAIGDVKYGDWLGPAGPRAFDPLRFHQTWPWFWDYGGGELSLWGVHLLDVAIWGMNAGLPTRVSACGGRFEQSSALETPDTLHVQYTYDDFVLTWEHRQWTRHGQEGRTAAVAFHGDDGTLIVDRGGWKIYGNRNGQSAPASELLAPHLSDFIDSIRTRREPSAPAKVGHQAATICHLGNIAWRSGHEVAFDPLALECSGDAEATRLL
jgi:predicted dehydrogenase